MQTSLIETRAIEKYLNGTHSAAVRLLFEAKLILDPDLATHVKYQEKTYRLIAAYSRKRIKQEIATAETILFTQSTFLGFREKILKIFK